MAYIDFPDGLEGQKKRKAFWLSPDGLMLMSNWRRNGVALTDIATKYVGVSKTAFWGWYRESADLRKAMADAKDLADATVENALYRRAVGYDYYEDTWELVEGELRKTRVIRKHVPPETKAIMQWLFNRLPNRWRAQQEPLESTQYTDTVQRILVAMKEVAERGITKEIKVDEGGDESGCNLPG